MSCKCKMPVEIKIARVRGDAKIPSKREEDAAYDLYANFSDSHLIIEPFTSGLIPTGIATVIPSTHYAQIFERGSTGVRSMKFGAGVIDSGFRGEWQVCMYNGNKKPLMITKEESQEVLEQLSEDYVVYPYSKAIAQFVVLPVPQTNVEEISHKDLLEYESNRGIGMLGSSNK